MPTGPGLVALAKPSPTPPTTAVPQSGPITSRPRSVAVRLSATSWSSGTLSLKIITSWSASRASIASASALAPGTETSTRAPEDGPDARRSAAPVVRGAASSEGPDSARAASASSTAASASSRVPSAAPSSSRIATTMSLGPAPSGSAKPMPSSTSTFSGVAIATWAVATPGTPWTVRLTCSSRTESAYAPGRVVTWVFMQRWSLRGRDGGVRAGRRPAGRVRRSGRPW